MPILPRETDVFPHDFLEYADFAQGTGHQWWVLYTLSRREKDLMRRLVSMEVPFYCPLIARKNRSPSGRVRTSYVPLFPGYVFSYATAEQRQQALTTNCISRTLPVVDHDQRLVGIITTRDMRFCRDRTKKVAEVMTRDPIVEIGSPDYASAQ